MNREYCIFNSKKGCNNCGECERCDLNSNKKCNNCGKCLELEGFDMKAIKIDEIIDDAKDSKEVEQQLEKSNTNEVIHENHYQLPGNEIEGGLDNINLDDEQDSINSYDDYESEYSESNYDDVEYSDELDDNLVYIDDVEGLSDLLEEDKVNEMYPGILRYNREEY